MNRGFYFGDGFFETIRLLKGRPTLLDYHIQRAKNTARYFQMHWPESWNEDELTDLIRNGNRKNHEVVRVDFFRTGGGLYAPEEQSIDREFSFRALPGNTGLFSEQVCSLVEFEKGVNELPSIPAAVYTQETKPIQSWSAFKTSSALFYVQAGIHLTKLEGAEDLILLNDKNMVCEGLSSNLLIKYQGDWISPSLDQGGVEGVYLAHLQSFLPILRSPVSMEMLENASVVLLTNAVQGVRKVHLVG